MILSEKIAANKALYLFEIDDVLINKRDYLVQVFYLFGSFYEFSEGDAKANEIAMFMTKVLDLHGEDQVFLATQAIFNIDDKYEDNYQRLMVNAQVPIKLDLFPEIKSFLVNINKKEKDIGILTKGNPIEQLNKLKFIDWGPLEFLRKTLKIFFIDELEFRSISPLEYIAKEYNVESEHIIHITQIIK